MEAKDESTKGEGEIRELRALVLRGCLWEHLRLALIDWLGTDLPLFFTGRVLCIDEVVADRWGRLIVKPIQVQLFFS